MHPILCPSLDCFDRVQPLVIAESEGPQLLAAATAAGGLPKRSSVPVLKDQDAAAQGDPAALNYAFLQVR